jgi:hypothetical protein
MPFSFQLGLFSTVLVLAGVRLLRSLREVMRPGSSRANGARGPARAAAPAREAGPAAASRLALSRWRHLAILWGIALFCLPFLVGVALPGRMAELSAGIDSALGGGPPRPEIRTGGRAIEGVRHLTQGELEGLERSFQERTRRAELDLEAASRDAARARVWVWAALAAAGAATAAAGIAGGVFRARGRPRLMSAAAAVGLAVAVGAFALSGPAASRLSGAAEAARAIESLAAAPVFRAEDAGHVTGPVRLVGGPTATSPEGREYLYLTGSGEDAGGGARASRVAFRLGPVLVAPSPDGAVTVLNPHARLGEDGAEAYVEADEDLVVLGYLLDGCLAPRGGYPVALSPAGAKGLEKALGSDILGTTRARRVLVAFLQIVFAAAAAWFVTVVMATLTEVAASRLGEARRAGCRRSARAVAGAAGADGAPPPA